jgi:hypothetical protein
VRLTASLLEKINCPKEAVDIPSIVLMFARTLGVVGDETETSMEYRILRFLIAFTSRAASLLAGLGGHFRDQGENYSADTEG